MGEKLSKWAQAVNDAPTPAKRGQAVAAAVQHYANVVLGSINGYQRADMPFILAALKTVHDKILESTPSVRKPYESALNIADACARALPFTTEDEVMTKILQTDEERREFMDTATKLIKIGFPERYIIGEALALMEFDYVDGHWEKKK